jgi:hypothetical protein
LMEFEVLSIVTPLMEMYEFIAKEFLNEYS